MSTCMLCSYSHLARESVFLEFVPISRTWLADAHMIFAFCCGKANTMLPMEMFTRFVKGWKAFGTAELVNNWKAAQEIRDVYWLRERKQVGVDGSWNSFSGEARRITTYTISILYFHFSCNVLTYSISFLSERGKATQLCCIKQGTELVSWTPGDCSAESKLKVKVWINTLLFLLVLQPISWSCLL